MIDMNKYIEKSLGLPIIETTINVYIYECNYGALVLEKTLPPQFTPQSKHCTAKTIWFCEKIVKRGIKLCKIDTVDQLGDIFTKGLIRVTFGYLRKKLMGWKIYSVFYLVATLLIGSIALVYLYAGEQFNTSENNGL